MSFPDRFDGFFPKDESKDIENTSNIPLSTALPQLAKTNDENETLLLSQFIPAWEIQAYVRMSKIKYLHVQNSNYPSYDATGELPQLKDGNFICSRYEILPHLQTHHVNLDIHKSKMELAEIFSFSNMITTTLHHVLLFSRWMDPTNYTEVFKPLLSSALPFPLSLFLPSQYQKKMANKCYSFGFTDKSYVYAQARDCYTSLSDKLADQMYFFGDEPTSLDALVFGHVVHALNDIRLKEVLIMYGSALISFAERIKTVFFTVDDEDVYTTNKVNCFNALENAFMMDMGKTISRF